MSGKRRDVIVEEVEVPREWDKVAKYQGVDELGRGASAGGVRRFITGTGNDSW